MYICGARLEAAGFTNRAEGTTRFLFCELRRRGVAGLAHGRGGPFLNYFSSLRCVGKSLICFKKSRAWVTKVIYNRPSCIITRVLKCPVSLVIFSVDESEDCVMSAFPINELLYQCLRWDLRVFWSSNAPHMSSNQTCIPSCLQNNH